MKTFLKRSSLILLASVGLQAVLSLQATKSFAEVVLIVNPAVKIDSIAKSDVARIFLGKTTLLPSGQDITPLNQYFSSDTRGEFDKQMLRKSPGQIKAYWSKQLFTGEGSPPEEVPGDLDVLKMVLENKAYIGYVDDAVVNDGVKVLKIH